MLSFLLLHCVSCQVSFNGNQDQGSFPLCRLCNEKLIPCPHLCSACGSPVCRENGTNCTRPWILRPEIHSYSSRYLLLNPCYSVLKKWKTRRGRIFDRKILKSNSTVLEEWSKFQADAIVALPQNYHRAWKMGGSRAERIAFWVRSETGLPVIQPLEADTSFRKKKRQAERGLMERLQNKITFHLNRDELEGIRKVILVDDFMTTGKTIHEAAKILRQNGVEQIHVFCLGVRVSTKLGSST